MADFDPDAYLAAPPPDQAAAFDPDAYLSGSQTTAPKSFTDRLANAWEKATPGGPLWLAKQAVQGIKGAVEGSEAAVAPQVGTEEEEFARRSAEEAGPGQALQAAAVLNPAPPGGSVAGKVAGELYNAAVPKAVPEAVPQTAISASERLGIPISRAATSESPTVQSAAGALKEVPFVGTPLVKSAKNTLEGLDTAARDTAAQYGSADTVTGGEAATQGIEKWITGKSGEVANRLYGRVDDMVDPAFTRDLHATKDVAQTIMNRRANANITDPSAAVREVENAITAPGGMNYKGLKDLRTYFRDMTPQTMISKGIQPAEAKQIYGALTEDLRGTILDGGGPQALNTFDRANGLYGQIADRRAALAKIIGANADAAPERVMERLTQLAGSKGNADANKLMQARRAIGPDGWDEVTSAVVNRMGRASPEAEFSGDRFVTAWDNMSDTGKRVLFNSTGKPELAKNVEDIMTLSRSFKQLKQLGNPSGTGRVNAIMSALGALGGAIAGTATIGLTAPLTMLGSVVGGRSVAYALSRPLAAKQVKDWSQAYVNAIRTGSPRAMAVLSTASARLAGTIGKQPNLATADTNQKKSSTAGFASGGSVNDDDVPSAGGEDDTPDVNVRTQAGPVEPPSEGLIAPVEREDITSAGPKGIKAYHGSPHDFDAFDLSKIGTGEGAQAYGHGLYFAENEGVAKAYRENLAGTPGIAYAGSQDQRLSSAMNDLAAIRAQNPVHPIEDNVRKSVQDTVARKMVLGDIDAGDQKAIAALHESLASEYPQDVQGLVAGWAKQASDHIGPRLTYDRPGRMYEVNINADPEHFLDWERPFAEQSPHVQDAIKRVLGAEPKPQSSDLARGYDIYDQAINRGLDTAPSIYRDDRVLWDQQKQKRPIASNMLNEAGIPGIKYLDQGSRTAGEGSRNYVVFNDKLVNIKRKYKKGGTAKRKRGGLVSALKTAYAMKQRHD